MSSLKGVGLAVVTTGASFYVLCKVVRWLYNYWCRFPRPAGSRSMKSFAGQVVLITGASSGLGEALARYFYQCGAKVILTARSLDRLKTLAAELTATQEDSPPPGQNVRYAAQYRYMDIVDFASLPDTVHNITKIYGTIDIVVHNAGISSRGFAGDLDGAVLERLFAVNFHGPTRLSAEVLPIFKRQNDHGGAFIVISSVQGKIAIPHRAAYGASKHAVQAFFDSLRAEEESNGIRVMVVSPGYIRTNLSLNALTGDGTVHNQMDASISGGYAPEMVAERIGAGYLAGYEDLLIAPGSNILAVVLRNILPSLYFRIMAKRAQREESN